MSELIQTIGMRLRNYRQQRQYSQEVLAERAGLHATYIGQVERGEKIAHFHTAVFDLQAIDESDGYDCAPPKTDPRYYFRPWKTILARTVADGGKSFYVRGEHRQTVPNLARLILTLDEQRK